jgi:hypothetical protein
MLKDYAINDHSQDKECSVRIEYANGFVIERSKKKGKTEVVKTFQIEQVILNEIHLKIKGKNGQEKEVYLAENEKGELKNSQKVIEQRLGINFTTFCKSIILGQVYS